MRIGKEGIRKLEASLANIALFLSIFVVLFPLALPTVSAEPDLIIYVDDDDYCLVVKDILRSKSQFNSFKDLIGRTIEYVEEKDDEVILTLS